MFRYVVTEHPEGKHEMPGCGAMAEVLFVKPEERVEPVSCDSEGAVDADVLENEKEILIVAELPGMKREEIKITVENDVLSIHGDKKAEEELGEERSGSLVRERTFGHFLRSFLLPKYADKEKISAEYKDGVLRIRIPKKEDVVRRIEIRP